VLAVQTESIVSTVIPHLFVRHEAIRASAPKLAMTARGAELARLLIAPNPDEGFALIERSLARTATPISLFTDLLEPAARSLGDLWSEDSCSEFEVSIGLCHLQSAIRRIGFDHLPAPLSRPQQRSVLVISQPGEPHSFCAALNSEMLRHTGWKVVNEFPACDLDVEDIVAGGSFDALNLSLSPSLRREHWLPRMAVTVRKARHASRNPALVVIVSGRVFAEQPDACASVGADAATVSAQQVERRIMRAMLKRAARPPANFAWL